MANQIMRTLLFILAVLAVCCKSSPEKKAPTDFGTFFKDMEAKALKESFRGIATEKGKESGLFPIKSTGVSTEPIQKAAEIFLSDLNLQQQKTIQFEIEDDEWRKWSNVDNGIYDRQGVSLKEMTESQKKAAFGLMQVIECKGPTTQ